MEILSSEAERIRWRRNKVLELSSEGRNQHQIASVLKVGMATVNRDLQFLREQARNNIGKYHQMKSFPLNIKNVWLVWMPY